MIARDSVIPDVCLGVAGRFADLTLLRLLERADGQLELLEAAVEAGGEDGQAGEGGHRGYERGQPDRLAAPVDDLPGEGVQDPQGHLHHLASLHYGQADLSLTNLRCDLAHVVSPLVPDIH